MTSTFSNQHDANGATTVITDGSTDIRGTVRVAPAVLIELVELTVASIQGFAGLRQRRAATPSATQEGARTYDNGKIAVSVRGDQIDVGIGIAIERGTNVSELTSAIQRQIGFAVGNMLGMTVRTVDINIEEIIPGAVHF